ncbi:hypothetical protein CC80DRAFT_14722 [Byssothecium circinans]|uniref:Uncharacterized protein n=1 Tax=Byssothecium circinans TaxID=147558 RepID=A0A6A5U0Y0_9PLEO|nr:hypothetical protein CC80DRAFT_14722 [Byssothecium circinans]
MCNGHSTRTSQGGSIAVLKPCQYLKRSDSEEEMRLLFSNYSDPSINQVGTQVELHGWEANSTTSQENCWVVIHASSTQLPSLSNPFFSFPLDGQSASTMRLQQKLDLGVGDTGIIGRRISVMTSSRKGPLTVAEGIVGWN